MNLSNFSDLMVKRGCFNHDPASIGRVLKAVETVEMLALGQIDHVMFELWPVDLALELLICSPNMYCCNAILTLILT